MKIKNYVESVMVKNRDRNTNTELLRLIIMFAIFLNHMLSHGVLQDKGYDALSLSGKIWFVSGTHCWFPQPSYL